MKPFFCYYGGKWRSAPHYPKPLHKQIIEPFAGAAGYSTRYNQHAVLLMDKDPVVVGVWKYLIEASASEIRTLPLQVESIHTLPIPQEARWLIGFWLNKGSARPGITPSAWMRSNIRPNSYWGEAVRERLAQQVDQIRHWVVKEASYETAPDVTATWFVDPPYSGPAGRHYAWDSVDFDHLGRWCRSRRGQALVCESSGASWLPFESFRATKASPAKHGGKVSHEVLFYRESP